MGRVILYKGLNRFFGLITWITLSIIGLISTVAAVLAILLSQGPIPLDFAIPYIERQIQNSEGSYDLNMNHAQLIWDEDLHRLVIQAKDLTLKEKQDSNNIISIPDFELRYRLSSLLKARLMPSEAAIIGPRIRIYQGVDGKLMLSKDGEKEKRSLALIEYLPRETGGVALKTLRTFILEDLVIDIENIETGENWQIPKANIRLNRHKTSIDLDLSCSIKGALAQAHLTADLVKENKTIKGMQIDLHADLKGFQFDDLDKFWHETMAPLPRKWVIENLNGADVSHADLNMKWHIDFSQEQPSLNLEDINGKIQFKGMQVQYLDTMPKVNDVDGTAHYDREKFIINVHSGRQDSIKVHEGKIVITNMNKKDQDMSIDLKLSGPLHAGLDILHKDPINLDKKIPFKANAIKGSADVVLHFDFPLEKKLQPKQVKVKAEADLKSVSIGDALGEIIQGNLASDDLHLSIENEQLIVHGNAEFANIPIDFSWQQDFRDNPEKWRASYIIKANLAEQILSDLKLDQYIDGPVELSVDIIEKVKDSLIVKGRADLTNSQFKLPLFHEANLKGQKAELIFEVLIKGKKLKRIDKFSLSGEGINLDAIIKVDQKSGKISELIANHVQIGKNEFTLKMKQDNKGEYYLDISSSLLNLKSVIDHLRNSRSDHESTLPIHISLEVDRAQFSNDKFMKDFKLSCFLNSKGLQELYINAEIDGHRKNRQGYFATVLESEGANKNLHISSNNAGLVFSMLGITTTAKNGKFHINAQKRGEAPWIGKLTVKHFYLTKAPIVTHILSLASPLGIIDAMTGQAITFSKFRTMFKYNGEEIIVKHGRAAGKSIGFTFSGILEPKENLIDIHGTIMPYNAFNMFLTKIPLVGTLLGGKGGGIIGINYHLKGDQDHPHSSVNPLSVFTPGILRQIFSPAEDNDLEDEEDNDQDEDDDL